MEKLYIKNMVCRRCKIAVEEVLKEMNVTAKSIELGVVTLNEPLDVKTKKLFETQLNKLGFELIDDKKNRLIEKIKSLVIDLVHQQNGLLKINLSDYLSQQLAKDYHYLSNLFSEVEGTTIEKFFIGQKIEKVKELLVYDELSLSEIAFQLNYSSVAYLSSQFKKVTGLTPSFFKNLKGNNRKSLDEV